MNPLTHLASLSLVVLLLPSFAYAGDPTVPDVNAMKQKAKGGASPEGVAVVTPIGPPPGEAKVRGEAWGKAILDGAAKTLVEPDKARCIVAWVNANGCTPDRSGKLVPLNEKAWEIVVKQTRAKTEIIFETGRRNMSKITGHSMAVGGAIVPAVAVAAELKTFIEKNQSLRIGTAGKNSILFLANTPEGKPTAEDTAPAGIRGPHELLHLSLRQLDNKALGGGVRKALPCVDIANRHHQLTGALGLAESKQSTLPDYQCPIGAPPEAVCKEIDVTEDNKACGVDETVLVKP